MIKSTEWKVGDLFVEISPCSWMYENGLQLKVSLTPNACNAESEFLNDKSIEWQDATRADADRMIGEFVENGGIDKVTANIARYAVISAALEKEIAAENKLEAARLKREDAKQVKKGCTHRVDAWVHPGGDDYQITMYCIGEPSKEQIAAILKRKRSRVTTDYCVVPLS